MTRVLEILLSLEEKVSLWCSCFCLLIFMVVWNSAHSYPTWPLFVWVSERLRGTVVVIVAPPRFFFCLTTYSIILSLGFIWAEEKCVCSLKTKYHGQTFEFLAVNWTEISNNPKGSLHESHVLQRSYFEQLNMKFQLTSFSRMSAYVILSSI